MSIVIERIEYLKEHPDYEPRPGKLHYGRFKEMSDRDKVAVECLVKALSSAMMPNGDSCLDVYREMNDRDRMTTESIVEDVLLEISRPATIPHPTKPKGYLIRKDGHWVIVKDKSSVPELALFDD